MMKVNSIDRARAEVYVSPDLEKTTTYVEKGFCQSTDTGTSTIRGFSESDAIDFSFGNE